MQVVDNKLQFNLETVKDTHLNTEESSLERWGSLSIVLLKGENKILLLQTEWNLSELVEWLTENQEYLRSETLAIRGESLPFPLESLAQCLKRLQERDFAESEEEAEDDWFNALFNFRQHHALRFALRGAAIPDVIIGLNHGEGEISLSTEENEWCYPFSMDNFLSDFLDKIAFWEL